MLDIVWGGYWDHILELYGIHRQMNVLKDLKVMNTACQNVMLGLLPKPGFWTVNLSRIENQELVLHPFMKEA
jgi:hypothetical protein